jgi:hypothetical protein
MSSRSLADIELARAKLLHRQTNNENAWNEFNANPVVPKAKQKEVSIEDWTVFRTNLYVGTKQEIAIALERLRVEEARLRSLLAVAQPVTVAQPGGDGDLGFGWLDKQPSFDNKKGGHKSARRVKSRSKSRSRHKCRSRTKSKSRG